jgi:drug/metabolite transporter (DMT)-like permease
LVAFVGMILITIGGPSVHHVRTGLLWGLMSGAGYGVGLTVVIDTSSDSGVWPSVSQRIVALALMAVVATVIGAAKMPPRGLRTLAAGAGVVAGSTTLLYIGGVQIDAQPAVVTASMFPAASVLGGWFFYEDPVGRVQILGIGAVLAGVVGVVLG